MGQIVKFGRTLSQIGVSRFDPKEGWQQKLNDQRSLEIYSKIPKKSEYSEPEETENHLQTAKLRSHSLSSSEIFYLLSINALLSSGNVQRTRCQKYKTSHANCMIVGPVAEWLKGKLMNIVQKGYVKREDKRLQTARINAALSVARLSTVVAGTIGNCTFGSNNLSGIAMTDRREDTDMKMHAAITSAAALVAASCAEVANAAGATREQVSSVINMGLETRALGDLLTLTTSAAACLRGVEGLKMRTSKCSLEGCMNNQKDATLLVRTPKGRFHNRIVSVQCKYDNIILTLGKKCHFKSSEKYVIFHEQGEGEEFSYPTDKQSYCAMNLSTSGGTIQLLFEEHEQYNSWRAFISYHINKGQKLMSA
ncbi:hypothetical protein SORBI_3004G276600 [Sorghum bicolor]|uniref:VAN3-binding protein-like auxin canalisation domain-containing protein n=1 Tax=Sorghum bicolor TaxID=4558 RepID=A0A1Z5RPA5_SORBI|nr:hypothetical protein SORBI_3004G276600 [Sorghum bicolor]